MDGKYTLKVTYNDELVFSFIGLTEVTAKVSEFSTINISMNAGETYLESVVVTAIGVKRKKEGDYSDVGAEELYQAASPNAIKALKGKVSGFQISTSNNTVITGENTIDQNSEALIVIDNIISDYKTLQRLDKAAILSTEILKGVQGAALYGEAGSKGVILITTKKAAEALNNIKARKNLDETAFFFSAISNH